MKLTLEEQETTINYNQASRKATVYTTDKVLIEKMDKLSKKNKNIVLDFEDSLSKTYVMPKSYIEIKGNICSK